jgi:hypothetical protein
MRSSARPGLAQWVAVALLVGGAGRSPAAQAQSAPATVSGTVRDSLGLGIAGAGIELTSGTQRSESDASGKFTLRNVPAGSQELVVRRIGYRARVIPLSAASGATLEISIELEALAQRIAPVVIRGRENLRGNEAAFYARRATGRGRFLTAAEIDRRQLWTMRDIMRTIPGARTQTMRGRQVTLLRGASVPPVVFLDGVRMAAGEADLNMLDPRSFLGVEIYSGPATTPPEFAASDPSGRNGGVILVWTREGRPLPRRPRRGESSAASLVAELLAGNEVRTEDAVDRPVRLDPGTPLAPLYPDSLFEARIAGSALAEFVVEPDGQVRTETLSIVTASHPAFGAATRDAILSVRFIPAAHLGRPVAQVVLLPVRFEPSEPAARPQNGDR